MQVTPTRLGVHALLGPGSEDIATTNHILVDREVLLRDAELLDSWQPDLVLEMEGREFWFGHGEDIFICVRFQLSLNRGLVWSRYQPQQYSQKQDVFLPNIQLINLNSMRDRLVGTWRLDAAVAAFRRQAIEEATDRLLTSNPGMPPGQAAKRYMDSLEYLHLGSYAWKVVEERQLITSSGEFVRAVQPDQLQQVEVNLASL